MNPAPAPLGIVVVPQIAPIDTPAGPARAHRWAADPGVPRRGRLVLGHGAGGRSWSADLLALTTLAADGWEVILVEQPWRVAGRKVATPPTQLDAAWTAVLEHLAAGPTPGLGGDAGGDVGGDVGGHAGALVLGGRSAGARVACRTATRLGADAVVALAFPLHPPGKPERCRAGELAAVGDLSVLVVQGRRDPFGTPAEFETAGLVGGRRRLVAVAGGHGFGRDVTEVVDAVRAWLAER